MVAMAGFYGKGLLYLMFLRIHISLSITNKVDEIFANVSSTACLKFYLKGEATPIITVKDEEGYEVLATRTINITHAAISPHYRHRLTYTGSLEQSRVSFCLHNVTRDDSGEYYWTKTNGDNESIILYIIDVPTKPSIKGLSRIPVGSYTNLTCASRSRSLPPLQISYIWTLNGSTTNINYGQRNVITGLRNSSLKILDITIPDKYNIYRCIATESQGLTSRSDEFHIIPLCSPRSNVQHNHIIYVKETGFLNLTASVYAFPTANVTWYFRNMSDVDTNVESLDGFLIINNKKDYLQRSSLQKYNVKDGDYADYTVVFKNRLGESRMMFHVIKSQGQVQKHEKDDSPFRLYQTGIALTVIASIFLVANTYVITVLVLIKVGKTKKRKKKKRAGSNNQRDNGYCDLGRRMPENVYETCTDNGDGRRTITQNYENTCIK